MSHSELDNRAAASICHLKSLIALYVESIPDGHSFDDVGCVSIAKLKTLQKLAINRCAKITNKGKTISPGVGNNSKAYRNLFL
jgi:hypothetical protein